MGNLKQHVEDVLSAYEGTISIKDIKEYYAKNFYVELKGAQLNIIKDYMAKNHKEYKYNENRKCFETDEVKDAYLYVADNRYFNSIEEVMRVLFGRINVQKRHGYFKVSDSPAIYAWFPQFDSKDWENLFLNDGLTWTEKPLTEKNVESFNPNLTNEYRYIFAHEKSGYRFTGLFQETEIKNGNTRIYSFIDDKLLITDSAVEEIAGVGGVTTQEVDDYVKVLLSEAKTRGETSVIIDFHKVRDHFGERVRHRAPTVCNAIRKNMTSLDRVVYQSPKGNSSLFEVEFNLSDK